MEDIEEWSATALYLKSIREKAGLSIRELADLTSLDRNSLRIMEKGERPIRYRTYIRINRTLGYAEPFNTYGPDGSRRIELDDGSVMLVDDEDYERCNELNWHNSGGYAICSGKLLADKTQKRIQAHRFICPEYEMVDHINHDTLDNRKCNLRAVTASQNQQNRKPYKNRTSRYKGVCWVKDHNKWKANIRAEDRNIHLGYYFNEEDAHIAYELAAEEYFGEFAYKGDNK